MKKEFTEVSVVGWETMILAAMSEIGAPTEDEIIAFADIPFERKIFNQAVRNLLGERIIIINNGRFYGKE